MAALSAIDAGAPLRQPSACPWKPVLTQRERCPPFRRNPARDLIFTRCTRAVGNDVLLPFPCRFFHYPLREARLHDVMMARELKCEGGSAASGALRGAGGHTGEAAANLRTAGRGRPIAGAQAGVLARTQGSQGGESRHCAGRLSCPERDLWQRIERARHLLELEEGVRQSGLWCTCRDTMPHEKRLKGL